MQTKYFRQLKAWPRMLLCGLGLLLIAAPLLSQQQPAPTGPIVFLDKTTLQQDAALQGKISLEARRMPLRELLAEAQKQSGITLRATADSPATRALMTARLKDMTLATLMNSLTRIYDVRWTQEGAAYTMHGSVNDELSYRLIRYQGLNATQVYGEDREKSNRDDDALAKDIFHSIDKATWDDNDTVLVSALPKEMQQRLRQRFELEGLKAEILLERRQRVYGTQKLHVRLHIPETDTVFFRPYIGAMAVDQSQLYKMPRLMTYNSEGRFIAGLFPEFHGPKQPLPPPRPDQIEYLDKAPLTNDTPIAPRK